MFFQYSIYVGLEIKYLRINPIQIRFIKDLSICSKIWKKDCHIYIPSRPKVLVALKFGHIFMGETPHGVLSLKQRIVFNILLCIATTRHYTLLMK